MKKVLSLLLTLICFLTLVACTNTNESSHEHTYSTVWSHDAEYHWYAATCEHTNEVSGKVEHTFDEGVVTKEPTTEVEGEKTYTCTVCGGTKIETLATVDHVHTYESEYSGDQVYHWYAATCEHTDEVKDKAEHTFDEGVVTKEPTLKHAGEKVYTCSVCKNTKTIILPKLTQTQSLPNTVIDTTSDLEYVYEGTATYGPYTVYNADGTVLTGSGLSVSNPNTSMYNAIRLAGEKSTSKNKMYVLDANGLLIFQRQTKSDCWCYDGTNFVGVKTQKEAEAWAAGRQKSYVVDGQGKAYVTMGINYYENSDLSKMNPDSLEMFSGGYNYLFSDSGILASDQWAEPGFGYMEVYVRLSEAKYMPTEDGTGWNAYIFINGSGGYTSDLGLIGNLSGDKVNWRLVRNCSHDDHKSKGDSFMVLNSGVNVTQMSWSEEEGCYTNGDDLFFQCWQTVDGWILKITNLTTGVVYTINEIHEGMFVNDEGSAFKDNSGYFRFLLAASYCPVVSNVWNARCGAYLRNVVFDHIKIARFNESNVYTEDELQDFYPGVNMAYGYSQGTDCSSMIYATREADGVYKSGQTYAKGDQYLSFSCYYDGGSH